MQLFACNWLLLLESIGRLSFAQMLFIDFIRLNIKINFKLIFIKLDENASSFGNF